MEDDHMASPFFWDIVTGERSLAFGGNSRREHFPAKDDIVWAMRLAGSSRSLVKFM